MRSGLLMPFITGLIGCLSLTACAVSTGYQTRMDEPLQALMDKQQSVYVAVTEIDFSKTAMSRKAFFRRVGQIEKTLKDQPGFLAFSKRVEPLGKRAWTMTLWEDATSTGLFVYSSPHGEAVEAARSGPFAGRFAGFTRTAEEGPPRWADALAALDASENGYGGQSAQTAD